MDDQNLRRVLEKQLVAAYEDAYKEVWETWKLTEVKAQGVIVASGFFLAALVAFLTKATNPSAGQIFTKIAITLVVVCVASAITFSSIALLVREVLVPPQSGDLPTYLHDVLKETDDKLEDEERMLMLHRIDMWKDCIGDAEAKTQKKVRALEKAQIMILAATFLVAAFVVVKAFAPSL